MFEHGFSIINRPWTCLEAVLLLVLQLVPAPVWVINTVRRITLAFDDRSTCTIVEYTISLAKDLLLLKEYNIPQG